ncbi:hypothetical protein Tco_0318863 [Tanacetum coccineum]
MIHDSVLNGPLILPTIEVDGVTRPKPYEELSEKEKLQAGCDLKATNIVLQGLPPDVYSLVNHHKVAKEIWDRVRLLMKGTKLSQQEHVKLARDLHETNYDQLYAYLSQHEAHDHEVRLAVPSFLPGDDLIARLNKAMAFMSISFAGTGTKGNATSTGGNNATVQVRVVKCYNCQGEGNMARQCTQSKSPRNSAWFKEKMLLVQAQESGQVLDEEQLAFLADLGVVDVQATQTTITHNAAFQTDDLDAYDSDCDDISSEKAVLLANLSSYDSDVISEVPQHDTYQNDDMINQSV